MKKKNVAFAVLAVIFAGIFIFSAYKIVSTFRGYAKGRNVYGKVIDEAVEYCTDAYEDQSNDNIELSEEAPPISVDFDKLFEQNKDVVGWIYCEDTPVNYPVLQSDDNDYYLRRMINGEYNIVGSVFMDYRCSAKLDGLSTIVYGHNMNDDSMFGTFTMYKDQSYYEEHPVIWFFTPECNYKIELISGYVADKDSDIYNIIESREELDLFIDEAVNASDFSANVNISSVERILILSTCSYEYSTARYVLIGSIVPV